MTTTASSKFIISEQMSCYYSFNLNICVLKKCNNIFYIFQNHLLNIFFSISFLLYFCFPCWHWNIKKFQVYCKPMTDQQQWICDCTVGYIFLKCNKQYRKLTWVNNQPMPGMWSNSYRDECTGCSWKPYSNFCILCNWIKPHINKSKKMMSVQ